MFKKRENVKEIEEGKYLSPKFDENGLIPVITVCFKTKDILKIACHAQAVMVANFIRQNTVHEE